MPKFIPGDSRIGKRVELHPATNLWKRGARYGVVERVRRTDGGDMLYIRMDHPQVHKPVRTFADDVTYV